MNSIWIWILWKRILSKMRDINTELDIVSVFIRDAEKYGLVPEVVLFALKHMKNNPDSNVEDAMNYGYWEWCK